MMARILESIGRLQESILESGLARSILALQAPRMLALPAPTTESESGKVSIFTAVVTEAEIVSVSRDLFASGHYSLAVQEAYKAIDKFIGEKAKLNMSGKALMNTAFSPKKPILIWNDRQTVSEQDEQEGYHQLYAGAMQGIRNPVVHEFDWVEDQETALELLTLAQHLLHKAKYAHVNEDLPSHV